MCNFGGRIMSGSKVNFFWGRGLRIFDLPLSSQQQKQDWIGLHAITI